MTQQQLSLFDLDKVVNVASVPKRSPFRYPGGKTWLVPRIRQWLSSLKEKPSEFIEPFTGGGIVSLTVAFERLANHVLMVELDEEVAAVWLAILGEDAVWLADRIASFELTIENVEEVLSKEAISTRDKAFKTILKNRVQRGGILANGAGLIKYGENGKGIASRWYPDTLKRRILDIATVKERITAIQGDGLAVMEQYTNRSDAVFFIDPPYTSSGKSAGSRLYNHSQLDHERLFTLASNLAGDFLMTYDNAQEVQTLAEQHGFDTEAIAMKNTHHAKMTELLIGRNLDWIRQYRTEGMSF